MAIDPSGNEVMTFEQARERWMADFLGMQQQMALRARFGVKPVHTLSLDEYIERQKIIIVDPDGFLDTNYLRTVPIQKLGTAKVSGAFSTERQAKIIESHAIADTMIRKAAEILNNDDLWGKASSMFKNNPNLRGLEQNRDFYKKMVNIVLQKAKANPPDFQPGSDSTGSGSAYTARKGGPVFLKNMFFGSNTKQGRANLIIHEYGRTYLWDFLPKDETIYLSELKERKLGGAPLFEVEWVENWDRMIQSLDQYYYQIKYLGK